MLAIQRVWAAVHVTNITHGRKPRLKVAANAHAWRTNAALDLKGVLGLTRLSQGFLWTEVVS